MDADFKCTLNDAEACKATFEKQVLLLRGGLQKLYVGMAECNGIILENCIARLTGKTNALNETIHRPASKDGRDSILRRYGSPNTTGDTKQRKLETYGNVLCQPIQRA